LKVVSILIPVQLVDLHMLVTLRTSKAVAQCIVIGPVCGFVCVWMC